MKISLKWLADYVECSLPAETLAERLTMSGLEVEAIERPGKALEGVVVAEILESSKHPNADKLAVTRVSVGGAGPLQIVCGAKNFRVGDKVPLATPGAILPGGLEIKRAALRGVESAGMLCSAKELGLAEDASGLLILEPTLVPGTPLARALGLDDVLLEINVTPNRADALSHLGVAREVATLLGVRLRLPPVVPVEGGGPAAERVRVRLEEPLRCPRYAARVVEGLTVGPSPRWMQERLSACGIRPINNLVDVTNYVLLEAGQPLHAFDLDRIAGGEIVVRSARAGESLRTLDGVERRLDTSDLLICDAERPLVLAGVMGGASSEVSERTARVLIECASFHPTGVRRSARRHALHTESSHRFERGTDIEAIPWVLDRAAALMAELGGGRVLEGRVDVYPSPRPRRTVTLRTARLAAVLGVDVPPDERDRVLSALGFERCAVRDGETDWRVPSARVDVSIEEDLIEEVARIRGYGAIPPRLLSGASAAPQESPRAVVDRRLRAVLAGRGVSEVVNYSFVSPAELEAFGALEGAVVMGNPLSVEQSVMRTTLFASLVANVQRARRHQVDGVAYYELARTYRSDPHGGQGLRPVASEVLELAGVLWGLRGGGRSWAGGAASVDFYDAKGCVESLLAALHVEGVSWRPLASPWYHPRAAASFEVDGTTLGTVGELHPRAQKRLDAPSGIYLFQLDVAALEARSVLTPKARELSRFPSVLRDVAVVVPREVSTAALRALILQAGKPLVDEATLFDVYEGPQVGAGRKNVAFALRYRSPERTLTDGEVSSTHEGIVAELGRRFGGALRGNAAAPGEGSPDSQGMSRT